MCVCVRVCVRVRVCVCVCVCLQGIPPAITDQFPHWSFKSYELTLAPNNDTVPIEEQPQALRLALQQLKGLQVSGSEELTVQLSGWEAAWRGWGEEIADVIAVESGALADLTFGCESRSEILTDELLGLLLRAGPKLTKVGT